MRSVWLWWSTGKDSAWALAALRADPDVHVTGLVTTVTAATDRVAVHGTRTEVLEAQARAVGLPVRRAELPHPCSNDQYEASVAPLVSAAAGAGVEAMAFADLFLADVRAYRDSLLVGSGVEALFPLWGRDTRALAEEMIDGGLEAYLTCVDPKRVPAGWAGRRYDHSLLRALGPDVDPCGERGEFHTCVVDGPMFEGRLDVRIGAAAERDGFVYADVELR